jgi:APA family basic amino acid/polyamine antiporter
VIGASRITYAMSGYRQLPAIFRRLHRRFMTPWISLVVFAGLISTVTLLPGQLDFLGTMYSFGAMLSFAIAHVSVIALRYRRRDDELLFRGRPNLRLGGVDWPVFAVLGALSTGLAWFVVVWQTPETRYAGLGWLAAGLAGYAVYRRWFIRAPLTETVRAPTVILVAPLDVAFRSIVVPVRRSAEADEALVAAARLATKRRSRIAIVTVIEVPLELPLAADLAAAEEEAARVLDQASAVLEPYGVRTATRVVRARSAGPAIVEDALGRDAELIVVGAPRTRIRRGKPVFGHTVDYVLKHSPIRVLIAAGKQAA